MPASRRVKLAAGTLFAGRYEILADLGRGGMGHVYRARHTSLAKDVALKVLATDPTGDFEARFAREARAIARLDHPGCVRVLDHGRSGDVQYIAMELLDGDTLGAAIRAGRFVPARAVSVTRQLLLALAHVHAHGVIHRDVKPENVMLVPRVRQPTDPDMPIREPSQASATRAVLIDFGLASLADELPLTARGMCVGSPSYLAPERLLGQPHDVRTDLYAVGVILYEMLAGEKPFSAGSPAETMRLALARPPRPLRAHRRDIPPSLDRVIQRALAKNPARRFADAEDMLLALDDALDVAAKAEAAERDEAAQTLTFAQLDVRRPSWLARAWSWLRYGTWRWRLTRRRKSIAA